MANADKNDIAVVILSKNESEMIEDCLKSVAQLSPNQILVIDNNSTDQTVSKAKNSGAKVFYHKETNFAKARNIGLNNATSNWILYIDADERISPELADEINLILKKPEPKSAYAISRVNFYLGKRWPHSESIVRLFRRSHLQKWIGEVHESAQVSGETGRLKSPLFHYTHRNLEEMVKKTITWSEIEARLRYAAGHPRITWWRIPRVMTPIFFDYFIIQGGWRLGSVGLIESLYQAFSIFITYARLWELQNQNTAKRLFTKLANQ